MKILLVSHGDFAKGLCSTMNYFFGADNVYYACVTLENGTADLLKKVEKYLEEFKTEQVVICSDLKSGSANQTVFPFLSRPDTFVISGMNLSLVLQIQMEEKVTIESLQEIIANAQSDMVLINTLQSNFDSEEDE